MIKSIESTKEIIELKKPFTTALRTTNVVEFIRVKVALEDGRFSYGEAPATKAITGETLGSIQDSIELIKKDLLSRSIEDALVVLHKSSIGSSAKASLDMALFELSVGGFKNFFKFSKSSIKTDITISLNSTDQMFSDAIEAYESGFDILKIKVGSNIDSSINIVKKIQETLPKTKILVDANQAWSRDDTLYFIDNIANVELIEQPVIKDDIASLRHITKYSHIPILADEAVFSFEDAKNIIDSKAAHMINIKLMKCGGLTNAIEILSFARKSNIPVMLGSMLEGPYSINAALYLAFAYNDVIKFVDLDSPFLYKNIPQVMDFTFAKGGSITPL